MTIVFTRSQLNLENFEFSTVYKLFKGDHSEDVSKGFILIVKNLSTGLCINKILMSPCRHL